MSKRSKRGNEAEVPIAEMRGVVSFDYDGATLFVQADVESVARAFTELRQAGRWEQDVANREVELAGQCFFVLRLNGHTWTCIYGRDSYRESKTTPCSRDLGQEDARLLSERLGTRAMYYIVSDTACALGYYLYENGRLVEQLETGEGYEVDTWESERGHEEPEDVEEWVQALFRELDALEPGLRFTYFAGYIMHEAGHKVTVGDDEGICERLDFVAC